MRIKAKVIAKVIRRAGGGRGVSVAYAHETMSRHGMEGRDIRHPGGRYYDWQECQLFGVFLSQFLWRKYRTDPQCMAALLGNLIALGDEQLDAVISGGRSWIMSVGNQCAPDLFHESNVTEASEALKAGLAQIGAQVVGIDVAHMWEDLKALVRAAVAEETNVSN